MSIFCPWFRKASVGWRASGTGASKSLRATCRSTSTGTASYNLSLIGRLVDP